MTAFDYSSFYIAQCTVWISNQYNPVPMIPRSTAVLHVSNNESIYY